MFDSLKHILHKQQDNSTKGITVLASEGEISMSYADLHEKALYNLVGLQNLGVGPGDEVIVVFEEHISYISMFWACVLGDMIPIPIAVLPGDHDRIEGVLSSCAHPYLMYCGEIADYALKERLIEPERVLTIPQEAQAASTTYTIAPKVEPVFIQFSSGSTSAPKGVMIRNENILANIHDTCNNCLFEEDDVFFSWIPITHNFGLILLHIVPLCLGAQQIWLPTNLYPPTPFLWIDIVNRWRATIASMTNYGIAILLQATRTRDLSTFDLSCLSQILTGGEMISAELSDRFLKTIAECGARDTVFAPGYGMSEATVAISLSPPNAVHKRLRVDRDHLTIGDSIMCTDGKDNSFEILSMGKILPSISARIADLDGRVLGDRHVGLIHLRGKSISDGYYRNETMTREVFSTDGWLNTGDIGFFDGQEIYITSRAKDMIIYNGRNYFSNDIEALLVKNGVCEANDVVIISVKHNMADLNDRIICFVKTRQMDAEACGAHYIKIRDMVSSHIGISVDAYVSIPDFPMTSSGKVRKFMLKEQYAQHMWDDVEIRYDVRSGMNSAQFTDLVIQAFEEELHATVQPTDPFALMGLTSLQITRTYNKLRHWVNRINVADMYGFRDIEQLVAFCIMDHN